MKLKQGKFYDEAGNVVPLEFGNKEQIYLLDRVRTLQSEGEELTVFSDKTSLALGINCVCGEITLFGPDREDLEGAKATCDCGYKYQISASGWPIVVKMVKK